MHYLQRRAEAVDLVLPINKFIYTMYMESRFYILLSIFLYICIIYSIAPIVDHLFMPLDTEKSEVQLVTNLCLKL